jgi:DNA-binding NtrC family response regulator
MATIALVVDDDPAIRAYVCVILRRENFETLEANGGNPAWRIVETLGDSLALIVTDIQMPNGDGLTFANAVRQAHPSVPIILTSGRSKPDTAFAFIEKPFSWATLVSLARKLVTSGLRAA